MLLKYPYLSVILNKKTNEQILCLVQIISKSYVSFYDMKKIKDDDKDDFIKLSNIWWNLNRSLPISVYYQNLFNKFNYAKSYLANNEYILADGYEGVRLKNLADKRIKRKVIHLDDGKK